MNQPGLYRALPLYMLAVAQIFYHRLAYIHVCLHFRYNKFAYEDIREVHKRRYLLQPIAIEVFSSDGRNYLLAFPKKVRNKVYSKYVPFFIVSISTK